ncbi:AEC family transporter [Paracoccus sp. Ld10]|uniref:AEC family transporter n=1 Tax=Paracoccus sp. Ld10 TaxID=649158 RepID=UPI0038658B95
MVLSILSVTAPVLIIIALGYLWARMRMPFDNPTIGALVLRIGTPCLIFSSLTNAQIALADMGTMVLAAVLVIGGSTVLGAVTLRIARLPLHTYLMIPMHGNSGNMGLPLAAMVFGPEGLALGIAYFTVVAISQNTLGHVISAGRFDLRSFVGQPVVHASVVTIAVLLSGVAVPAWLARTTEMLAGMVIPTMLLLLGVALSRLKVADLRLAAGLSVMRFAVGALAATVMIVAMRLGGAEAGVVWIMATMPAAAVNVLFAERYARSPEKVAGTIVVSTVATLAGLPVIVWMAMWIAA